MGGPGDLDQLLSQELRRHPLGEQTIALARARGIAMNDSAALAQVIGGLDAGPDFPSDRAAPLILILARMLDRCATHEASRGTAPSDDIGTNDHT